MQVPHGQRPTIPGASFARGITLFLVCFYIRSLIVCIYIQSEEQYSPLWASQVVQWVKNPPAMQEMQKTGVQSPGLEDPLKEGMGTHFSILAWEIPWTEQLGRLQLIGSQRAGQN